MEVSLEIGRSPNRTPRRGPAPNRWLAAYDISGDQRRVTVSRRLERYGHRIQYSVYGLTLPNAPAAHSLAQQMGRLLRSADAFLLLPLCDNCELVQVGRPYPGTPGAWAVI